MKLVGGDGAITELVNNEGLYEKILFTLQKK